jgi:hypothetical protein
MSGSTRLFSAFVASAAALLAAPAPAHADGALVVSGARVELGELCPTAPEAVRGLDVGPAPPPGGSALLDRERVLSQLRAAGVEAKTLALPKLLRVVGASKRWTPPEVTAMVRGAVEAAMPRGVTLAHLETRIPLVAAPDAVVGHAEVPKPPKHAGVFRTSIVVPIIADGAVVTLVIDRRGARIGAAGIALADGDVGDVGEFRVDKTGRIVKARLDATDLASVVSP